MRVLLCYNGYHKEWGENSTFRLFTPRLRHYGEETFEYPRDNENVIAPLVESQQ